MKNGTSDFIANAMEELLNKKKDENCAHDHLDDENCGDAMMANDGKDKEDETEKSAFDVAINNLLKASEALDSVGMEKSASLSLRLAGLVVEAKKKDKEEKENDKAKEKEKKMKEKEKEKAAKEKAKEKEKREKEKEKKEKDKNELRSRK